MSRGPGSIMRAVERTVFDKPTPWRYAALAEVAYSTDAPSRAQLSAVARAVNRLAAHGTVDVLRDPANQRQCFVKLRIEREVLECLTETGVRMTYDEIGRHVFVAAELTQVQRLPIKETCERLAYLGAVQIATEVNDRGTTECQVRLRPPRWMNRDPAWLQERYA